MYFRELCGSASPHPVSSLKPLTEDLLKIIGWPHVLHFAACDLETELHFLSLSVSLAWLLYNLQMASQALISLNAFGQSEKR